MDGILCFGDSITFGRGGGWVGRLKEYFESRGEHNGVYNLGVPGHTSTDLVRRFEVEATSRLRNMREGSKFIILIAIGINDAKWDGVPSDNKPRTTLEHFERNMQTILAKAKSFGVPVVCIGLTPVDESKTLPYEETAFENKRVQLFNDTLRTLAATHDFPFLDMFAAMSCERYQELLADGLHPNAKGYDFMFAYIKDFLQSKKLI